MHTLHTIWDKVIGVTEVGFLKLTRSNRNIGIEGSIKDDLGKSGEKGIQPDRHRPDKMIGKTMSNLLTELSR